MASPLTEWSKRPGTKEFLLRLHDKFINLKRNNENFRKIDAGTRTKDTKIKDDAKQKVPSKKDAEQQTLQLSSKEEEEYLLLLILVTCLIEDEGTDRKVIGQLRAIQKGISQVLRVNYEKCQVCSPELVSTLASEMTKVFKMKGPFFCNFNLNVSEAHVTSALKLLTSTNVEDVLVAKKQNMNSKNRKIKGHVFFQYILNDIIGFNISKP